MEQHEIIKLSKKNIETENLEKAKKILENNYIISYGKYDATELKKAISSGSPVFIQDNFLIGFDPGVSGKFVNSNKEKISIDRMVKAIIVEDVKADSDSEETGPEKPCMRDPFAIIGNNSWGDIPEFYSVIMPLRVGEIYLPPHSAIFNFLEPSAEEKKKKIVSMLNGVNVCVYDRDNYIDNCIHEIGHLFWRDCLIPEEKKKFQDYSKVLRPSAIYQYEWERSNEEEIFCTIYKWYVKSILVHPSFLNILEFEEPEGLKLFQSILERIAKDRMVNDIWESAKIDIDEYINPKYDIHHGRHIRRAGLMDKIKDIEVPRHILNNVDRVENGVEYMCFGKASLPTKNNIILYDSQFVPMEKAESKPVLYFDMDGVVTDFVKGYRDAFGRDAYKDDPFTINQFCLTSPNFFRYLPENEKGMELYDILKDDFKIVFLTTPMQGMKECKRDKIEWLRERFGNDIDVIFSDNKEEYVVDEKSILVDDMKYNLQPWQDAGGTAIDIRTKTDRIIETIQEAIHGTRQVERVKSQLDNMDVDTNPTEKQKESGNYKKGMIDFKGIKIKIENPKGSIRWGLDGNGIKWINRMHCHYGYIQHGGNAVDGDKIDVFIGPKLNASRAFVVNQVKDGMFDEHKVMLGFDTIEEAEAAYMANYQKGWKGLGSIVQTNTKKIRDWLGSGNFADPFECKKV